MSEIKYIPINRIKPNPYRSFDIVPINRAKVDFFKNSISKTNFWCTIVGRQVGKNVEIAFGHNRLEALREIGYKKVGIIIDDICDARMIKMMAYENDDSNGIEPRAAIEAVRSARRYLIDNGMLQDYGTRYKEGGKKIGEFLGWNVNRVNCIYATLRAIEAGNVTKEVQDLKTYKSAVVFRQMIHKTKLPLAKQKELLKKVKKGEWGTQRIRLELIKYVATTGKDEKMFNRFLELSKEMKKILGKMSCPPRKKHIFHMEMRRLMKTLGQSIPDHVAELKEMMA